jgi:hypothetical protein
MFVHCRSSGWIRSHRHHLVTGGLLRTSTPTSTSSLSFSIPWTGSRRNVTAFVHSRPRSASQAINRSIVPGTNVNMSSTANPIGDHGHVQLGQLFEPGLDRRLLHKRLLSIDEEVEPWISCRPSTARPWSRARWTASRSRTVSGSAWGTAAISSSGLQLAQPPDRDRIAGPAGRVVPVAGPSTTWAGLRRPSAS